MEVFDVLQAVAEVFQADGRPWRPVGARIHEIAAAVGLNISSHSDVTSVNGKITAGNIVTESTSRSNMRTLGSGIAMSVKKKSNSLAAGVAVLVNSNSALVLIGRDAELTAAGNDLEEVADSTDGYRPVMEPAENLGDDDVEQTVHIGEGEYTVYTKPGSEELFYFDGETLYKLTDDGRNNGSVRIAATQTVNMDGDYRGWLTAQSLAGSVAGSGNFSIGGAIAVAKLSYMARVDVASGDNEEMPAIGTSDRHAVIKGGDVSLDAYTKAKNSTRAGGMSIGKGTSVGIGAAFSFVIDKSDTVVVVGSFTEIDADTLNVIAKRDKVTLSDYVSAINKSTFITDSSKLSDEERENADLGMIDIHKGEDDASYSVKINISTDTLLSMLDSLNFLSSQNVYAEAIAGSLVGGSGKSSKAAIAGAFAIILNFVSVEARIDDSCVINVGMDSEDAEGTVNIHAENGTNALAIGGGVSAGKAKTAAGLALGFILSTDSLRTVVGSNTRINASGAYSQYAHEDIDFTSISPFIRLSVFQPEDLSTRVWHNHLVCYFSLDTNSHFILFSYFIILISTSTF